MLNPAIIIILTTIASICMLYYGASFLISGALSAASRFKISDTVVSITLIAGATSLPELFILFQAIHHRMAEAGTPIYLVNGQKHHHVQD